MTASQILFPLDVCLLGRGPLVPNNDPDYVDAPGQRRAMVFHHLRPRPGVVEGQLTAALFGAPPDGRDHVMVRFNRGWYGLLSADEFQNMSDVWVGNFVRIEDQYGIVVATLNRPAEDSARARAKAWGTCGMDVAMTFLGMIAFTAEVPIYLLKGNLLGGFLETDFGQGWHDSFSQQSDNMMLDQQPSGTAALLKAFE